MTHTKTSEIVQLLHDNFARERMLDFYLQEYSFLKTRLAEILDHNGKPSVIAMAESFQTKFLYQDEHVSNLRKDILKIQKSLRDFLKGKDENEAALIKENNKIDNEMKYFGRQFSEIREEFQNYVVNILHVN